VKIGPDVSETLQFLELNGKEKKEKMPVAICPLRAGLRAM